MKKQMIVVSALASLGAFGTNVYWSNAGTGNWETESNWQGDALPGVADTAINNVGGTVLFTDGMEQTVCDYIAGMTDNYAVDKYTELFIPNGWNVRG